MPFILRGIALLGVNSSLTPLPLREAAWQRLAHDLDPAIIDRVSRPIGLTDAQNTASDLLAGRIRGRVSIRLTESS
jgi:acrylyl-CoA reductase (NADPH)